MWKVAILHLSLFLVVDDLKLGRLGVSVNTLCAKETGNFCEHRPCLYQANEELVVEAEVERYVQVAYALNEAASYERRLIMELHDGKLVGEPRHRQHQLAISYLIRGI